MYTGRSTLPPMKITKYDTLAAATVSSGEVYVIASDGVVIASESSSFQLNGDTEDHGFPKLPSSPKVKPKQSDGSAPSKEQKKSSNVQFTNGTQSASNLESDGISKTGMKKDDKLEDDEYEYSFYQVTPQKRRFLYSSLVVVFALIALAIIWGAVKAATTHRT